jgi:hypothetical protein
MELAGGGWTRCLEFANTEDEDLGDNDWFDRCVDWTMGSWTGSDLLVRLEDESGETVYWATGLRPTDWTYDHLTSTSGAGQQLPSGHDFIQLSTGDFLAMVGKFANNGGCYGGWSNGYQVLVFRPFDAFGAPSGEPEPWPMLSVMPYRDQMGSSRGEPRWFWRPHWTPGNEITYWRSTVPTPDPCSSTPTPSHLGSFEFYVR